MATTRRKKRTAGRAPRADKASDVMFTMRMTRAELDRWQAAARRQGAPVSDLVREGMELVISRGPTS